MAAEAGAFIRLVHHGYERDMVNITVAADGKTLSVGKVVVNDVKSRICQHFRVFFTC